MSDEDRGPAEVLRRLRRLADEREGRRPPDGDIVMPVQPYAARKRYVCPGCDGWIEVGEGHLVAVPELTPDLRRHWHRGCWHIEQRRRHGRTPT